MPQVLYANDAHRSSLRLRHEAEDRRDAARRAEKAAAIALRRSASVASSLQRQAYIASDSDEHAPCREWAPRWERKLRAGLYEVHAPPQDAGMSMTAL